MRFAKRFCLTAFLFICTTSVCVAQNTLKMKKPTGCFEFIDLYAKVVENSEDPTLEDQNRFDLTLERMMGYITGIEIGTRTRIMIRERGITELSLLNDVNRACIVAPNISLDEAILTLPVVRAALMNANNNNSSASCDDYCRENYGE